MSVTLDDLTASAARRGIKVATGSIPIDGVWVPQHRLVIISDAICPDSARYVEVLRHELGHAGADDVHETLDGRTPGAHRGYQPTAAAAPCQRRKCLIATAAAGAGAALAAVAYVAVSFPSQSATAGPGPVIITVTQPRTGAPASPGQTPAATGRPSRPPGRTQSSPARLRLTSRTGAP